MTLVTGVFIGFLLTVLLIPLSCSQVRVVGPNNLTDVLLVEHVDIVLPSFLMPFWSFVH